MVGGAKEVIWYKMQKPMVGDFCYNKQNIIIFLGKIEDEDKRRQENDQTLFFYFFSKLLF